MGAIIIKADNQSNKILAELAKKLGGNVMNLKDEQYEDFILGALMDSVKTGQIVSRESVMKKLKIKYAGDELYFIIGSDEAAVIDTWKKPAELLAMCKFIVVKRHGFAVKKVNSEYLSKMEFVEIKTSDVSSRNIRHRINHKQYFKGLVPEQVYKYIKEKELYI